MSEQPNQPHREQDKGTVFENDNVIDFGMAREGMKSLDEVRNARAAEQRARTEAVEQSVEAYAKGPTIEGALIELSNLMKTRQNYLETAA